MVKLSIANYSEAIDCILGNEESQASVREMLLSLEKIATAIRDFRIVIEELSKTYWKTANPP